MDVYSYARISGQESKRSNALIHSPTTYTRKTPKKLYGYRYTFTDRNFVETPENMHMHRSGISLNVVEARILGSSLRSRFDGMTDAEKKRIE